MKFGLDLHGIIDRYPEIFSVLSKALVQAGHEIHIITGPSWTPELEAEILGYGIVWTHHCSIIDYRASQGTPVSFDIEGRGWMDTEVWDRTKAEYCAEVGIDMHIDDSEVYGKYFTTPYLKMEKLVSQT